MPKVRSPNRDKAFEIYKQNNGNISLIDIATKLKLPKGTIRGWKAKDKWDSRLNGMFQKNTERSNKINTDSEVINRSLLKSVEENINLTDKQRLFCFYYIKNFNAKLSAIKAGYSKETAGQIGYQLLQKPSIKSEIKKLKQLKKETLIVDEEDIVGMYMNIAFADITDFVDFGTAEIDDLYCTYLHFKDSDLVDGSLISEISVNKKGSKIKLEDRQKALAWLSNYFIMNPMNKHKIEYDTKKAMIEEQKLKGNLGNELINCFMESIVKKESDFEND